MTSILTAAVVASLIGGVVPGQEPPRPEPAKAKAKAAGPAIRQAQLRPDRALTPTEAASRVGQQVTVELTVRSTGSNPAGFLELYSGRTWQEEGSFFIRFPEETQQKFDRLGIADVRRHFAGKTVRVTGLVQLMTFRPGGTHSIIVVQDMGQIEITHTVARIVEPVPAPAPYPSTVAVATGIKDEGAFFSPSALTRAARDIKEIERRFRRLLVIETFNNVPAERMDKFKAIDLKDSKATSAFFSGWAVDRWRAVDVNSIYVLMCKQPSYIQTMLGAATAKTVFTASDRQRLVDVLAKGFRDAKKTTEEIEKQQIYDKALLDAVALVRGRLESNLNPPRLVLNTGGHTSFSGAVLFSQDDNELITIGFDNTIRVWDARTLNPLEVVRPPRHGGLYRSALSADGRHLAVSSGDLIYLIARPGWKIEHVLTGHKGNINRLAFSADGERLASSANQENTVRIWTTRAGKCERTLEGHANTVLDVAFAPDGSRLLTSCKDGTARIWSLQTGATEAVLPGHPKGADDSLKVAWSPDGKTLATGGMGELRLWNADGTSRTTLGGVGEYFYDLQFTSDSRRLLLTQGDKTVAKLDLCSVIDVDSGKAVAGLAAPRQSAEPHTALSRDGKLALTVGAAGFGWVLWTVADGQIVLNRTYGTVSPGASHPNQARGGKGQIVSVGWSPEGNRLIAIGQSEVFVGPNDLGPLERSFDLANLDWGPRPTQAFRRAQEVWDSRSLILQDKETVIVKHNDGKPDVKLSFKAEDQTVFCYTLLPENRAAIGTRRYAIYIMDTTTGKKISSHFGHDQTVTSLAPSPDGQYLLTSDGVTIRVWHQRPTRLLMSLSVDGDDWIAWTPDGYFAASPGGERLMGWEVGNGPDQMASFYTAGRFRKSLYRPDVIKLLLEEGSFEKALAKADKERGTVTARVDVAQVLPPKVAITFPGKSGQRISTTSFEVTTTASSVGNHPVTSLRLLVDGRPYHGEDSLRTVRSAKPGDVKESWRVELPPGTHRLAVVAGNAASQGVSDEIEIFVSPTADSSRPPTSSLHLLVVGINAYPGRMKLDCAVPDAKAIDAAFRTHCRGLYQVTSSVLLDQNASRAAILGGLDGLAQQAKPGDVAVFFYAGHGDCKLTGQLQLLPVDVNLKQLAATGLSGDELRSRLGKLPCTALLIMDCCYAGSFDAGKKVRKRALPTEAGDLVRELVSDDQGLVVMCGASKEQESGEEARLGHGYFTLALTEGLAGKAASRRDGLVYLSGLQLYVEERVRELSSDEQYPTIGKPTLIRSFPLAKP